MLKTLTRFLLQHCDFSRPVLLALSGGPDSLALFALLLEVQKENPLKLHIAHVDHGWRPESGEEALLLQEVARRANLPFHLKKLDPQTMKGNLEALCRQERLDFYKQLQQEQGIQAVLLAHHADDQAETVLKRVFEGAHLASLGGLQSVAQVQGLALWRPLLHFTKEQLSKELKREAYSDATNLDPRFLRARMRTHLMPLLSQEFGKEVGSALHFIGQEAQALDQYLTRQIQPYLKQIQRSSNGLLLDLSSQHPPSFELRFLLRQIAKNEGFTLSRQQLETGVELLLQKRSDKVTQLPNHTLHWDRGRLFVTKNSLQWESHIKEVDRPFAPLTGWQQVWKGEAYVFLPVGDYAVKIAPPSACYPGNSPIADWWNKHKVPTFLRRIVPVVWQEDQIVHEFLTGWSRQTSVEAETVIMIILD